MAVRKMPIVDASRKRDWLRISAVTISAGGAMLLTSSALAIPSEFQLMIEGEQPCHCIVKWRESFRGWALNLKVRGTRQRLKGQRTAGHSHSTRSPCDAPLSLLLAVGGGILAFGGAIRSLARLEREKRDRPAASL